MAFDPNNLSRSLDGFDYQTYVMDYTTSDSLATVEGSSYLPDDTHFRYFDLMRVTANDGKAIYDITPGPALRKLADVSSFTSF